MIGGRQNVTDAMRRAFPVVRVGECSMRTTPEALREGIRGEYLEMPGLRVTLAEMQRLSGLERALCQLVLSALVEEKFLCVTPAGAYARSTDGQITRQRAAKPTHGVECERSWPRDVSALGRYFEGSEF
jgi:hypothetical protein